MIKSRTVIILSGIVSTATLLGVSFTGSVGLLGIIIGFFTGLVNIQWLFWDAGKAIDKELHVALRIYYRSLFSRLGMVTLVVAAIGRYRNEWLFFLVVGIAVGTIIPLILAIRQELVRGRG